MTAAQTETLELFILFGGAAFAALAGVAFLRAGLDRAPSGSPPAGPLRGSWTPFLRPAGASAVLLGLVGVVLTIVTSPLGPRPQLFASLFTGGGVGLMVALLGVTIDGRLRQQLELPSEFVPPDRDRRVALLAGVALAAGSASAASFVWIGLYLFNASGIPSLGCLVLGASLVWAAFSLLYRPRGDRGTEGPGTKVPAAERGVALYTLLLAAPSASAISAFVPSLVRLLQPTAVLFSMAAELVLLGVGLLALAALPLYRAGGGGTDLHLPLFASASFASVACLGLDAAFLGQSPSLLLALAIGPWLLFGTVELVAALRSKASHSGTRAGPGGYSSLESVLVGGVFVAGLAGAYLAANWTTSMGLGVVDADLGGYGVTLFGVALVGSASPFLALELRSDRPTSPSAAGLEAPVLAGIARARVLLACWVSLALAAASFSLEPYLLGLAPTIAASRLAPTGIPVVIGFLLGVALVQAVLAAERARGNLTARDELGRFLLACLLAVAGPASVAYTMGPAGLFYLVLGALAGALAGARGARSLPLEAWAERSAQLEAMLPILVTSAAAVLGGLFVEHAWFGAL